MSGIAIKLNTAMSGESVLGNVTFKESDEHKIRRYVSDYCEAIGDSTYESELLTMFTSMVENGLDTKLLVLYPLLGNTLDKAKVNALNPGVNDARFGGNASINNGELYFSSDIGSGPLDETIVLSETPSFSMLTVARKVANGINANRVYQCHPAIADAGMNAYLGTNGDGGAHIAIYNNSNSVKAEVSGNGTTPFYLYFVQNGRNQQGVLNGTSYDNTCIIDQDLSLPNTILGGNIILSNTSTPGEQLTEHNNNLWNGYIYFHAIGNLSLAESATLKGIVSTFLSDVRNIEI